MSALRSILFAGYQLVVTPIYAILVLLLFWLPPIPRFKFIMGWCWLMLFGARWICGIRERVVGRENLPPFSQPHIVMSKHSSTWETLALNFVCPPLAFVAKKELLSIPFFGWAFRQASPITIDRKSGSDAMTQIIAQSGARLTQGFWIVMYPKEREFRRARGRTTRPAARAWRVRLAFRSCRWRIMPAICGRRDSWASGPVRSRCRSAHRSAPTARTCSNS